MSKIKSRLSKIISGQEEEIKVYLNTLAEHDKKIAINTSGLERYLEEKEGIIDYLLGIYSVSVKGLKALEDTIEYLQLESDKKNDLLKGYKEQEIAAKNLITYMAGIIKDKGIINEQRKTKKNNLWCFKKLFGNRKR